MTCLALVPAFGVSSAVVFTTEVAAPHIRGALNGANPTLASAGMVYPTEERLSTLTSVVITPPYLCVTMQAL